jgi:hypothetical protein
MIISVGLRWTRHLVSRRKRNMANANTVLVGKSRDNKEQGDWILTEFISLRTVFTHALLLFFLAIVVIRGNK